MPMVPEFFAQAGENAADRFLEFFVATIRNQNTRRAYSHAAMRFANWCDELHLTMAALRPSHVAAYIEQMSRDADISPPTVKQHLSAIRMLFDWLVIGQVLPMNPTASVRGPKYVVKRGKTPVLSNEEARGLLESIEDSCVIGRRDRALIAVMIYSFARIGAVVAMNVGDYRQQGKLCWFRLHEKGGKYLELPAHHKAQEYLDAYIELAEIGEEKDAPLFRSFGPKSVLGARRLDRRDAYAIIRGRAKAAGLGDNIGCHTFRATGITVYLNNGGTLERVPPQCTPNTGLSRLVAVG